MKKTLVITGIIVVITIIGLIIFNKIVSRSETAGLFTEVNKGKFEITILTTGELIAENSIDIKGPAFSQGRDIHSTNIKITDLIPEGTTVNEGDYVATLDRTELENSLKDARERLTSLQTQLEVLLLDTALTMNNIRDQISNQTHTVREAEITLRNSKYESAPTIREAEINLDQAQRVLGQLERSYKLQQAQTRVNVSNLRYWTSRIQRRVNDYEEVLAGFTIYAPSSGMIIYKKNRLGRKRKVGSMIDAMDRVVATLPDLSSMISKVYVSEIEISKVKIGQAVSITIDAFPSKSYNGYVSFVANIGEKLPNTDTKVFEVQIKIDGSDYNLRPSMTTNNKIMIKTFENVTYIPTECVHTGTDSIPFVYTKNGFRQAVILGESNEKNVIIEKGLEPGTLLYVAVPDNPAKFKLTGVEIIKKGSR
ncbi:MAG: efflux RND transporter periplasmic adaptor subunit [Bacteroidia bacterium]|jgi:multidrug efflux pump subunit AcrA (membrane-fusion protein)|nr:efflux RND transporter periplasmic adaptor subunit [Bacteroidia bacterium]